MDAPELDGIDLQLLHLLADDARMSQRELARRVSMSAPAVADRLTRLERAGVIRGYRAELDREKLGFPLVAIIGIEAIQGAQQAGLLDTLRAMPEVEDVHLITGPRDLLVRVRVRDHDHLKDYLFNRIWPLKGVHRTETFVVMGEMEPKAVDAELIEMRRGGSSRRPTQRASAKKR
ncbi:MAG: Lrp/AsnC family transcriptional regulator [Acidimicrobiales bacterium]